jgi:hypothetical protein
MKTITPPRHEIWADPDRTTLATERANVIAAATPGPRRGLIMASR